MKTKPISGRVHADTGDHFTVAYRVAYRVVARHLPLGQRITISGRMTDPFTETLFRDRIYTRCRDTVGQ